MRYLLVALLAVGLLAGSSLGVVNIKLTADKPWTSYGEMNTIRIWAQGTVSGIGAVGGSIVASGNQGLQSVAGSFAWASGFTSSAPFGSVVGTAGSNGGWAGFGSQQTNYLAMDPTYGRSDYVEVAHYDVLDVPYGSHVTLTFVPGTYGGFKPVETNRVATIGTITGVTITTGVPEPTTLAMLAVSGLMALRRRR